jgi:hypothetical protein
MPELNALDFVDWIIARRAEGVSDEDILARAVETFGDPAVQVALNELALVREDMRELDRRLSMLVVPTSNKQH